MRFKFSKQNKSIVDVIFLLALFAAFLICALFIVLFGAKVYKKTVFKNQQFFNARTSLSYITEKIRQNDSSNAINVLSNNGSSVLELKMYENDTSYSTYIFCKDNMLMEYTANSDVPFSDSMGRKIMNSSAFEIEKVSNKLYKFRIKDDTDYTTEFYTSVYSDTRKDKFENEFSNCINDFKSANSLKSKEAKHEK